MKYSNFLTAWIRYDSKGVVVPGSLIMRPYGVRPQGKGWKQIPNNNCCACECIITFTSTATGADITAISSADGSLNWTGTLSTGDYKSFIIPNCYDMTYTMTLSTPSGDVIVAGSAVQGTGTISADPDTTIASGTTTPEVVITTSATCDGEYLVTLADD